MMPVIVTVTLNPTIDTSCSVDRIEPERKLRCSEPAHDPGGGGLNVARAIHRLGGQSRALWTCGGPIGDLLGQLLDAEQLVHQAIPIDGLTRENLIVLEQASGRQYRFGMPGPKLGRPEIERCLDAVRSLDPSPNYLVLSGSLPAGVPDNLYAEFVRQAPASCRVVVDTSGPALAGAVQERVFLIKPNLRELGQLAGRDVESDEEIESVARRLIDEGKVEAVVASLGSGGAVLATGKRTEHIRAPTVNIRSKVGAGDSTVAGIVLALARGRPLPEAVRFGVAAGAAAVMTPGTVLCRREDADRLFQRMK